MPKYLNTNRHEIYVDDPSDETQDLTRIGPGRPITATGAFADNLEETPGVFRSGSDEAKAFKRGEKVKGDNQRKYPPNADEVLATDGAHSFPVEDENNEIVTPEDATPAQTPAAIEAQQFGQEVAEKQEGPQVNFASDEAAEKAAELDVNLRDLGATDGSGKDGAITVKDVKDFAEQQSQPAGLDDASEEQLRDLADELDIDMAEDFDYDDADQRNALIEQIDAAAGGVAATNPGDGTDGTATNDEDGPKPSKPTGGTTTSDKVPKAS